MEQKSGERRGFIYSLCSKNFLVISFPDSIEGDGEGEETRYETKTGREDEMRQEEKMERVHLNKKST